jgi:hypothetical protein
MKIIITETQYNDLISNSGRRRMSEDDFINLDKIIRKNSESIGYLKNTFDSYLDWVIEISINKFVDDYKSRDIDYEDDDWEEKYGNLYEVYWTLIPFLKQKYYEELFEKHKKYNDFREKQRKGVPKNLIKKSN